jgi:cysteine-rich repeat protein
MVGMVKVIAFCTVILAVACTSDHPADNNGTCGDGILDPGVNGTGEECDDGNRVSGDGCSSNCQIELSICGNGTIEGDEECDDGNKMSGDGCSSTCTKEAVCGNGTIETGEQCDDGNTTPGDGCSATCKTEPPVCGNGHVETGEQCDDGNTVSGDGCSSTCKIEVPGTTHTIAVSWTIKKADNTVVLCPAPDDTASISSQLLDAMGNNVGLPTIDVFDCNSPGAGITTPLASGVYNVHVDIKNHLGTTTYASSLAARVDITTMDKTTSATIYSDAGYIRYTWQLVKASDSTPLTCADAGIGAAGGIHVSIGGPTTVDVDLKCTDPIPNPVLLDGSYTLQLYAHGNSPTPHLGDSASIPTTVAGPNQTTVLGAIQIPITGL